MSSEPIGKRPLVSDKDFRMLERRCANQCIVGVLRISNTQKVIERMSAKVIRT